MSAKATGQVFDANLNTRTKLILLAYADHADHEGRNIFPSIGLISWKTGSSPNTIRRHTKAMIKAGYLIAEGESRLGTNQYRIDFTKLPKRDPYAGSGQRGRPETNPPILEGLNIKPSQIETNPPKNEINPPIAMGPDPSLKPSLKSSLLKSSPKELKPKSEYAQNMEFLEKAFAEKRCVPEPNWNNGNPKELNKRWRSPLKRMLALCNGDLDKCVLVIRKVIEKMVEDRLILDAPASIEKNFNSFIADLNLQQEGGNNSPNFTQIWAKERAEKERAEQERLRKQGQHI